jgi:hypothetical protein
MSISLNAVPEAGKIRTIFHSMAASGDQRDLASGRKSSQAPGVSRFGIGFALFFIVLP